VHNTTEFASASTNKQMGTLMPISGSHVRYRYIPYRYKYDVIVVKFFSEFSRLPGISEIPGVVIGPIENG
jgi:hypothetical protein